MEAEKRFIIKFDSDAANEYLNLDNSVIEMIDKKIYEL
jgi:hypothetical protein